MRCLCCLVLLVGAFASAQSRSALEQEMFDLVNRERAQASLPALRWNDGLARAAQEHSRLLDRHRELSHQFPGEPALFERLGAHGLRFNVAAENVASGPGLKANHDNLMRSSGHRANILDAAVNEIGIGIVERDGKLFVTQNFAHVFTTLTEAEFRDATIAAFQRVRQSNGLPAIAARADDRLHTSACAEGEDTDEILRLRHVIRIAAYTASEPEKLAPSMRDAARLAEARRWSVGVCFKPAKDRGYGNFWIVAAFYGE